MKVSHQHIDEIFEFEGQWRIPSRCGINITEKGDKYYVVATELYDENKGTPIANVSASLAQQICNKYEIPLENLVYFERNPETNSKLSFYGEEIFKVDFDIVENKLTNPRYSKIDPEELNKIID